MKKELGVFEFPKPTHLPNDYVGCKNAIGDLPDLDKSYGAEEMKYDKKAASYYQKMMREGSNVIKNHIGTKHTEHVIDVISQVPEGGNHKDLPPGVGDSRKFNEAWTRYDSKTFQNNELVTEITFIISGIEFQLLEKMLITIFPR